jgi:hypothetical protein
MKVIGRRSNQSNESSEVSNQYVEGLAGAAIAIAIELVNVFAFGHSNVGSVLAIGVAVIGLLLTVTRRALESFFQETFKRVDKLAEIADLSASSNVSSISALLETYLQVGESEFAAVKQQVVSEAAVKLRRLAIEKRSPTLQTADYYAWLFRQFEKVGPGDYIHAVSLSSEAEWNDSAVERNFLQKNLDAASAGVLVSRIFIVPANALEAFIALTPIAAHTTEDENSLSGFYISRDELEKDDRDLLLAIGEGFIDFNGRVALEDRFEQDGRARGEVTLHPSDLERMQVMFVNLLNLAEPLSRNLIRKM